MEPVFVIVYSGTVEVVAGVFFWLCTLLLVLFSIMYFSFIIKAFSRLYPGYMMTKFCCAIVAIILHIPLFIIQYQTWQVCLFCQILFLYLTVFCSILSYAVRQHVCSSYQFYSCTLFYFAFLTNVMRSSTTIMLWIETNHCTLLYLDMKGVIP